MKEKKRNRKNINLQKSNFYKVGNRKINSGFSTTYRLLLSSREEAEDEKKSEMLNYFY